MCLAAGRRRNFYWGRKIKGVGVGFKKIEMDQKRRAGM